MAPRTIPLLALDEMIPGQEADVFLLLAAKEELKTKAGKPYHKVTFRGGRRELSFPIWDDSPWSADCRAAWTPGVYYKVRAVYRETNYGPQLEIHKIREVAEADAADGFDPTACQPKSRFDPLEMFDELLAIVRQRIERPELGRLVESILTENRNEVLVFPAARRNHHAFVGGLLEHTLSVTKTALFLADKYADYYPEMRPPLDKSLVVAGAILHDIGKLEEYETRPEGAVFSAAGAMIGHMLLGRDIVREAAAKLPTPLDAEMLLRLEHAIIAHQRLPEWGSPKPPMTPEAMLIHYADDIDAKFHVMMSVLRDDANPGPVTSKKNLMMQHVFRGMAKSE
ncbi:MAG: HD domain-containing protein [Pirellulales bacterium]|nr:HD domain-containing protein [Pirellulales bacterium]